MPEKIKENKGKIVFVIGAVCLRAVFYLAGASVFGIY